MFVERLIAFRLIEFAMLVVATDDAFRQSGCATATTTAKTDPTSANVTDSVATPSGDADRERAFRQRPGATDSFTAPTDLMKTPVQATKPVNKMNLR